MATLTYLTATHFDFGAVHRIAYELARAEISKPLIVTDAGIRAVGLVDKVIGVLGKDVLISIFDETPGNPTEAAVLKAFEQYSCDRCDGVLALGGGSSMRGPSCNQIGAALAVLLRNRHRGRNRNIWY